jgi:hypothetical protein
MVRRVGGKEAEAPMTSLPISHGFPRSVHSALRSSGNLATDWFRAVTTDRNLIIIAAFCLIGLLVTLNLIFRFPSFHQARKTSRNFFDNGEARYRKQSPGTVATPRESAFGLIFDAASGSKQPNRLDDGWRAGAARKS